MIKKVKNIVPWTYVNSEVKGQGILGSFYKKQLQKMNQKEFRVEKVTKKRQANKLYAKWKNYDNYFNTGLMI